LPIKEEMSPKPFSWDTYFDPEQKRAFLQNMADFINMMIVKQLRKSRENLRKLRHNYQ